MVQGVNDTQRINAGLLSTNDSELKKLLAKQRVEKSKQKVLLPLATTAGPPCKVISHSVFTLSVINYASNGISDLLTAFFGHVFIPGH